MMYPMPEETQKGAQLMKKTDPILEDYSFEVYWKDELTASVKVEGKDVLVRKDYV